MLLIFTNGEKKKNVHLDVPEKPHPDRTRREGTGWAGCGE